VDNILDVVIDLNDTISMDFKVGTLTLYVRMKKWFKK